MDFFEGLGKSLLCTIKIILYIITMCALLTLPGWMFMFLWNIAMVSCFLLPAIGFLPAMGAVILLALVGSILNLTKV